MLVSCYMTELMSKLSVFLFFPFIGSRNCSRWSLLFHDLRVLHHLLLLDLKCRALNFLSSLRPPVLTVSCRLSISPAACPIWWYLTVVKHFQRVSLEGGIDCSVGRIGFRCLSSAALNSSCLQLVWVSICWGSETLLVCSVCSWIIWILSLKLCSWHFIFINNAT